MPRTREDGPRRRSPNLLAAALAAASSAVAAGDVLLLRRRRTSAEARAGRPCRADAAMLGGRSGASMCVSRKRRERRTAARAGAVAALTRVSASERGHTRKNRSPPVFSNMEPLYLALAALAGVLLYALVGQRPTRGPGELGACRGRVGEARGARGEGALSRRQMRSIEEKTKTDAAAGVASPGTGWAPRARGQARRAEYEGLGISCARQRGRPGRPGPSNGGGRHLLNSQGCPLPACGAPAAAPAGPREGGWVGGGALFISPLPPAGLTPAPHTRRHGLETPGKA